MLVRLLALPLLFCSLSLAASPAPAALPWSSDPADLEATAEVTPVSCFGEANGSVKITTTGGEAPYHGDVDANGEATITDLVAGSYSYEVYDAQDVLFTVTVDITQPDSLELVATTLTAQKTDTLGTINVVPTGGTAPYLYAWSNGAVADTMSSLSAGKYTLTLTDANGCTQVDSFVVKDLIPPPTARYEMLKAVTCAGDSNATLQLIAEGGVGPYHGDINASGDTTLQNLPGGEYSYLIYDSRDSLVTLNATIDDPDTLKVDVLTLEHEETEEKGKLKIAVSGGVSPYTYDWGTISLAGDLITELDHGTYHLLLTDDNGCTLRDSFIIDNLSPTHTLTAAEVSIYPTLVTNFLRVDLQQEATVRRLTVLSATGQVISRREYANRHTVTVEARQLPRVPGTYVLWVETTDGRVRAQRFVSSGQ